MENATVAVPVRWMPPSPGAESGRGPFVSSLASCRLVADLGITVIGIQGDADREHARQAIRAAIVSALAEAGALPSARIVLHAEPGEAPWARLDAPGGTQRAWLAISHDGALSVAAISMSGAVGIDVQQVEAADAFPDWEPVARDYLGPHAVAALAGLPAPARTLAFALAWSEREARLKYLGRELVEWSADGDAELDASRCLPLCLPEGYVGALVLPPG
jgi:4'-phosphopantetheinyl transferase